MSTIDNHTLSLIISERMPALNFDSFSAAEWDLLVKQAQAEGVAPLVYWALSRAGRISSCPTSVQNSLRAMYFSIRMNNEQILEELVTLTRLFAQAGIPVVALKGICFALTIYPDLGLRPMVDLDLLVPASRLSDAVRIVKASGYVEPVPEAFPGLDDLLGHATCLQKRTRPFTTLEIHHRLVGERSFTFAVPVDWFWSQTEPLKGIYLQWEMSNLRMLTPTAQVLYASAHAMLQHGGRDTTLRWYYDLDRLIRFYADRMDWDLLLAQARNFEWSSAASAALSKVVSFFDTPVPQNVLEDLSKHSDRNAKTVAVLQAQSATHTFEEFQKLRSLNGPARLKLLLALIVPTPAYMRWRYGLKTSRALPVYYLYRWWEILKDATRTVGFLLRNVFAQVGHVELEFDGAPEKSQ